MNDVAGAGGDGGGRPGRERDPQAPAAGPAPAAVGRYIQKLFAFEEPLLADLRAETERREYPLVQVPPLTGLLLRILVAATGARRILEIGTLGGYSTLWMAGALPPGARLITLEKSAKHAALAREFVERASLSDVVEIRQGVAAELLRGIGPGGGFDMMFLDADKESYPLYLEHAARLLRPGGVLAADNALWQGRVLEEAPEDAATLGIQLFNRTLADSDAFLATLLPVGDGVALGVRQPLRSRPYPGIK